MKIRNYSIDTLKFFCVLGVICLHTYPFSEINIVWYNCLASIINTVVRVCVPLFFISTGYFLFEKCNKKYVLKYILKLGSVFLFWSVFGILYIICFTMVSNFINSVKITEGVIELLNSFKFIDLYYGTGIIYYHLWYLSALILVVPLLYFIVKKNLLEKMIILGLVLNIIGVLFPVFLEGIEPYIFRDAFFFGFFYILLGAFVKKYESVFKKTFYKLQLAKCLLYIIVLFFIMIVEKSVYRIVFNGYGDYFISTIPLAILLFVMCLIKTDLLKDTILNKMGRNTLGIYLIHPLIIDLVNFILVNLNLEFVKSFVLWQLLFTPFVLIFSYVIYIMLLKIKNIFFKKLI